MRSRSPEADRIAAVVERLAALIGAGVAPGQAWRYLAEVDTHPQLAAVVARLDAGSDVPAAIARSAPPPRQPPGSRHPSGRGRERAAGESWQVLAAAWSVASAAGAPLARCLDEIAATLRGLAQAERDTAAALASPMATTRLLMVLPIISVAGASLLGLDTLQVLVGSPAGLVCLAGGILLTVLGSLWSRHLVRRAAPADRAPGLLLDLTAVAVAGGGSLPAARALATSTIERLAPAALTHESGQLDVLTEVLALAERSGAPPAQLLRSEALRLRREAVALTHRRTAELGVWLMLPLGTCVLPAFLLLAVAPLLLAALPPALL
ncbi:type II secretion system F family protein [Herbiconiux sp. CPCC 205716]|uniref:Type II secretion system F family protein n=1 Tax=Herbiconiux gentiana TaxID=2970912 RepID=A0ABT2GEF4_9MICO|nr:type II secretion system F family protein [Herbiconiux gentiana]MCS5713670.1 type II secretion system F family protein [Herbiconiux gentiana]